MFEYEYDATPTENSQRQNQRIIAEGKTHFVVISTENCTSKAGNKQMKVTLKATDTFGVTNTMFQYFPALKQFKDKLIGFLAGCGMQHLYHESGKLDESLLVGCSGTMEVKHKQTEQYGLQAEVKFYYAKNEPSKPNTQNATPSNQPPMVEDDWNNFADDDIPF
jgi:hypothetical protein